MISTHILDTSQGLPASGVTVLLEKKSGASWSQIAEEKTNDDGRIVFNCPKEVAVYRLTFQIEAYFKKQKIVPFFMDAPVVFHITNTERKYHIPLLLNPYGYSTYRGS
ncbi:MAG: hydroxyisourate hydrolase [Bdellovibrionales bacterium]